MEMTLVPRGFYDLPLFQALTREEVDEIGRLAHPQNFQAGDLIFVENDAANHLDILWEGAVEIGKQDKDGARRMIALIPAPSVVGEMSLMTGHRHSCTGMAVTDVHLFRIRREDFMALLGSGSLAAYKVVHNLAQLMSARLRSIDEKMVALLNEQAESGPVGQEFADFRRKILSEWTF